MKLTIQKLIITLWLLAIFVTGKFQESTPLELEPMHLSILEKGQNVFADLNEFIETYEIKTNLTKISGAVEKSTKRDEEQSFTITTNLCRVVNKHYGSFGSSTHSLNDKEACAVNVGDRLIVLDKTQLEIQVLGVNTQKAQLIQLTHLSSPDKSILPPYEKVFLAAVPHENSTSHNLLILVNQYLIVKEVEHLSSTKNTPKEIGKEHLKQVENRSSVFSIATNDDYLFVCAEDKGLDIYSLKDVTGEQDTLKPIHSFDGDSISRSKFNFTKVVVANNTAYILDALSGVWLLDLDTMEINQERIDVFRGTHLAVHDKTLVVLREEGGSVSRYVEYIINHKNPEYTLINRDFLLETRGLGLTINSKYSFVSSSAEFMMLKHTLNNHATGPLEPLHVIGGGDQIFNIEAAGLKTFVMTISKNTARSTLLQPLIPDFVCHSNVNTAEGTYHYNVSGMRAPCHINETLPCRISKVIELKVETGLFGSEGRAAAAGLVLGLTFGIIGLISCAGLVILYRKRVSALESKLKFVELPQRPNEEKSANSQGVTEGSPTKNPNNLSLDMSQIHLDDSVVHNDAKN